MSLSPAFLDELRARTSLSALIGRTTPLRKAGREYKACCPFHDEKTPSFHVNDEKGFYHCFGCSAHGDAIRWLTERRGLSFMDAVTELAAEAGLELPAPDPQAARQAERRAGLTDVTAAAQSWFEEQLAAPGGAEARAYLAERGVAPALARHFGFGWAPDQRRALAGALARFGEEMLAEAGLVIEVEGKERYDRFRGRLMLPIRDMRGRVIAFGGRALGEASPKYLNSPDTPLFDKGRTLFHLNDAAPAVRRANRLILVEGYMDVVALAGVGIEEAVAPLGTALTETQLELAWRQVERPLLCFDGDAAGQRAAIRAIGRALPLLKAGRSLALVELPRGQDPDDVVRSGGASAFEALAARAEPLHERLWRHELAAITEDTPEARAALKARLAEHVASIADAEVRRHYAEAFRSRFDARFFPPRAPAQLRPRARRPGPMPRFDPPAGREAKGIAARGLGHAVEEALIVGLLRHPEAIAQHVEELSLIHPADQRLAAILDSLIGAGTGRQGLDGDGLLTILPPAVSGWASALLARSVLPFTFAQGGQDGPQERTRALADLGELIRMMIERPAIEAALAAAEREVARDLTDENWQEQQRLRAALLEAEQRLADLRQAEGGLAA